MTEKQLQAAIVEAARLRGWLVYHTFDSRHSAAGFPDLVLVRDGRLVFAELKDANRKPTPPQRWWLEELGKVDGPVEVYLWRPEHWTSGAVDRVLQGASSG